jgi:Mn-dependent DtxR family transcriptional regulator
MNWFQNQTDREWNAAHRISEQLRHERLERIASIIDYQESTPLGEPTPPMTMDRYRKEVLNKEVEQVRSIWGQDDSEIPDL